jgi:hypothetical protein
VSEHTELVGDEHGFGQLMQGDTVVREVRYDIWVDQVFHQPLPDALPTPGLRTIRGSIRPLEGARLDDLMRQEFTLLLQNGKRLKLQLGPGGRIYPRGDLS